VKHVLLLIGMTYGSSAMACEIDTPTSWLPGYSQEQVDERQREILRAMSYVRQHERTEALVAKAPIIYLARVVQAQHDDNYFSYVAKVEPLKAIKGKLPGVRTLQGTAPSSCGIPYGDGDGTYASVGELVVVFEGVRRSKDRPRGIDSVRMIEVRSGSLLDPVEEWLGKQPDALSDN
jgi:hypothetical protein